METTRIAVLMACHNRCATTLKCLDALQRQRLAEDISLSVYLVDDGSTDGTAAAVRQAHPQVRLLQGDGSLFWTGGMHRALEEARRERFDYFLWLNDDTRLRRDAISKLVETSEGVRSTEGPAHIIVGTTLDGETNRPTYGGVVHSSWWHPFRYALVEPGEGPVPCETMNGNCVLVSREVVERVGNMDTVYQHGFADYDYGLRARRAGCTVWIAPGFIGWCRRTKIRRDWRNAELSWKRRWAAVKGPKGLPPRQMLTFARRHGGPLWPIFWCIPYIRALVAPKRKPPAKHTRTVRLATEVAIPGSHGERTYEG